MTRTELIKGLLLVAAQFGEEITPAQMDSKFVTTVKLFLNSEVYSEENKKSICAAYLGFIIGRHIGFEQGKNFVFEHVPEEV